MKKAKNKQVSVDLITALNSLRASPASYIPELKAMVPKFAGLTFQLDAHNQLLTKEGAKAVNELIQFLKVQKPVSKLLSEQLISQACSEHVTQTGPFGLTGGFGKDEKSLSERLESKGAFVGSRLVMFEYGSSTEREAILSLAIADGDPTRAYR